MSHFTFLLVQVTHAYGEMVVATAPLRADVRPLSVDTTLGAMAIGRARSLVNDASAMSNVDCKGVFQRYRVSSKAGGGR